MWHVLFATDAGEWYKIIKYVFLFNFKFQNPEFMLLFVFDVKLFAQ